ncbi:LuxR C-terminal-related transcriptional regulator [Pseudomonas solani]|uniref:LuxR C-terminal-related transcriptional regulator n=1 Tax=Pseudomonas solani TaxID=2731552 RepID=UPI003C2EF6EA
MSVHLAEWAHEITAVLAQPPGQPQLQALTHWLQRIAPVDHFALFLYEGSHAPLPLFHTFPAELRATFVNDYRSGVHILDPFFLGCLFGEPDGLYSMRALSPDSFRCNHYFQAYYHRLGLSEELGYFTTPALHCRAVLSLMRGEGGAAFTEEEMRLLRNAQPVVAQVVRLAWEARGEPAADAVLPTTHVRTVFSSFGEELLTRREHKIAQLLLQGYSSQQIADQLRITRGTVKVHRRNLYDKLEVGSQAEFFGLFVRELMGAGLFSRPQRRNRAQQRAEG